MRSRRLAGVNSTRSFSIISWRRRLFTFRARSLKSGGAKSAQATLRYVAQQEQLAGYGRHPVRAFSIADCRFQDDSALSEKSEIGNRLSKMPLTAQTAHRRIWRPLWELPRRADLIFSFARQDLLGRYKGSALGIVWAVLTPVVMIAIFTFIFAGIFGARFGVNDSTLGLRALSLLRLVALDHVSGIRPAISYHDRHARKPREASRLSARNTSRRTSFRRSRKSTLRDSRAVDRDPRIRHESPTDRLWFPLLLIPQLLFALGAAWLIASLGVFLRDIAQGITLLLMAWMYLTPIIYPESIVPERFRWFIALNPFTSLVRSYRRVFLDGFAPDWRGLLYFSAIALVVFSSLVIGGLHERAKTSRM